jgi:membrane associated rhomboid family serine protease
MIPIGDSLRERQVPWVNYALILANFAVFLYELTLPDLNAWITQWGAVPCLIAGAASGGDATCAVQGQTVQISTGSSAFIGLLASMFIHAGWLHILGNMIFLWVFGDNVEDAMGHLRYLVFYLLCGIGAGIGQVLANPNSAVPSVGASGAIAGVLGAYLVLYPRASVRTLIPIIIIPWIVRIPAFALMILWFAFQVIGSSMLAASTGIGASGGVAYMAHIIGFLLGVALVFVFRGGQRSIDLNQPY